MDVDALSATQKEALAQLQAIMDGGDADVAEICLSWKSC